MSRRTPLIGAAVAVILVAAWFVAFWQPTGHHLKTLRAAEASALTEHSTLAAGLLRLERLRATLPAEEATLRASLPALPLADSVDTVIDQINALALADDITWTQESQSLGASASTVTTTSSAAATSSSATTSTTAAATTATTAGATSSGASTVALTLDVSGTYDHMQSFVSGLLERPRLIVIQNLSYAPSATSVSVVISATAFYDPTALPTVPKAAG